MIGPVIDRDEDGTYTARVASLENFITGAWSPDGLWISGCKMVWCFIWFWAATSKLNHHFPSVIMFMMNNGPLFPKFLKRRLFVSYLDDLRPSGHAGRTVDRMSPTTT